MNHRVTIGLPVRNGARYIREAVDSILAQTYGDFELLISDNASTDDTEQICQAYAARDRRIRYTRHSRDVGANRNFNGLVPRSSAPYFKWASSDDVIAPELLAECVDALDRDPSVVLVHSRTQAIGPSGERLPWDDPGVRLMEERPTERLRSLFAQLQYCNAQYGVMRTATLRRTPLFGDFVASDICLLAELCLHGKFQELPQRLLFRRFHEEAASSLEPAELMEHYGVQRSELVLYFGRHLWDNLGAVTRAPIGFRERSRALGLIARRAIWQRRQLMTELGFVLRHLLGRPYAPLSNIGRPTQRAKPSTSP
jgi:glycosyltransferase involved in cell wall biosynthesis